MVNSLNRLKVHEFKKILVLFLPDMKEMRLALAWNE